MGRDTFAGKIVRGHSQIITAPIRLTGDIASGKNIADSFGKFGGNILSGSLNVTGVSPGLSALDKKVGSVPIIGNLTNLGTNALEIQRDGVTRKTGVKLARNAAVVGGTVAAGYGAAALLAPGTAMGAVGASSIAGAETATVAAAGGASTLGTLGTVAASAAVTGVVGSLINKGQKAVGDFVSNLVSPNQGQGGPQQVSERAQAATPFGGYESIPYKGPAAIQPGGTMNKMLIIAAIGIAAFIYFKKKV